MPRSSRAAQTLADLGDAGRFLEASPLPGRLLLCAVTGRLLEGFASMDSPLELRGVVAAPAPASVRIETRDARTIDLSLASPARTAELLIRGDASMFERILSPHQLAPGPEADALQALARGAFSTRLGRHYRSVFEGHCRVASSTGRDEALPLLCAYRTALTSVHLLRTGELLCDLRELGPRYGFCDATDLAEAQALRTGSATVPPGEAEHHRSEWEKLGELMLQAEATTSLPSAPTNEAAVLAWAARAG